MQNEQLGEERPSRSRNIQLTPPGAARPTRSEWIDRKRSRPGRAFVLVILCAGCNISSIFGNADSDGGVSSARNDSGTAADSPESNSGSSTGLGWGDAAFGAMSDGATAESRDSTAAVDAGPGSPGDGGTTAAGTADSGTSVTSADAGGLPGPFGGLADGGAGSALPSDGGLVGAVTLDGGVTVDPSGSTRVPSPLPSSAVPAPDPAGSSLALTRDPLAGTYRAGCGEPSTCFLRASITTRTGNAYGATLSTAYPADTCARDIVDDKPTVLIGDSYPRGLASSNCSISAAQIVVGVFIPPLAATLGRYVGTYWVADDGFRSQWRLINGLANDSGEYSPIPGAISRLELWWYAPVSGGEAYGQLQVPIRHKVTGMEAVGYLLFDVRIR